MTYTGKVIARRGGENWRGKTAVKPGGLCLEEFKHSCNWSWIHPVGISGLSTAAGKVGLLHCAWASNFVLFSGHFSIYSVTATGKQCFSSSHRLCCGGVSPACQEGAEPDQVDVCLQPCSSQLDARKSIQKQCILKTSEHCSVRVYLTSPIISSKHGCVIFVCICLFLK